MIAVGKFFFSVELCPFQRILESRQEFYFSHTEILVVLWNSRETFIKTNLVELWFC